MQHVPAANGPTPEWRTTRGRWLRTRPGLCTCQSSPPAQGLTQKTYRPIGYRSYRRRLGLFSRQCQGRGAVKCLLDPLSAPRRGLGRDGEPGLYNDIELADDHFKPITKVLDSLFQHEEEVELPERCQEFFEQFQREHQEEVQAYLVRHQTMVKQLKDLLAGWHLLMRAGIPRWIHPQVQSICNGELTAEKVSRALRTMFNGDSKPSQGYHLQA